MIFDRPPAGWKRPSMPVKVKLDVVIRQDGRCKQTRVRLGTLENTRFDHRPALWERRFDTDTNDTIPSANDPAFIDAVTIAGHDVRTNGPGGEKRITTAGSDSGRRAKDRALTASQEEFRRKVLERPAGQKRKASGKIKGRSSWPKRRMGQ